MKQQMRDSADKGYLRRADRIAEWLYAAGIILALSFLYGLVER